MSAALNRADLIRCIGEFGTDHLERMAVFSGFAAKADKKIDDEADEHKEALSDTQVTPVTQPMPSTTTDTDRPPERFYAITQRSNLAEQSARREVPSWYEAAKPFSHAVKAKRDAVLPAKQPLCRWSRLWPFVQAALSSAQNSRHLDVDIMVKRMGRGETITKRLPYRQKQGWAPAAHVILDYSERLACFWDDFNTLSEMILQLHGHAGLCVWMFEHGPTGGCRRWRAWQAPLQPYALPEAGTPVLVLSDLGAYDTAPEVKNAWMRWGDRLRRSGSRAVALMPCPTRLWDHNMLSAFFPVCWDHDSRLPRKLAGRANQPIPNTVVNRGVDQLLSHLSPALQVEPALLRAARRQLAATSVDVGTEAEAWLHTDTETTSSYFIYLIEARKRHQSGFQTLGADQQKAMITLIEAHHRAMSDAVMVEERMVGEILAGIPPRDDFMQQVVKHLGEARFSGLSAWAQRFSSRQHASVWQSDVVAAIFGMAYQNDLRAKKMTLPEGLSRNQIAWVLQQTATTQRVALRRLGGRLVLTEPGETLAWPGDQGSLLGQIDVSGGLECQYDRGDTQSVGFDSVTPIRLSLPEDRLVLKTDTEHLQITAMTKPKWASAIGQDAYGLFAECTLEGVIQRLRWITPGAFMMGSPASERERRESERQHSVTFTQGYWMADTTCTQALWQAVMGENPSQSKSEKRPVQNVSWNDVQTFLMRVQQLSPVLTLTLPTEAQWEYACRAGTHSPFSFGESVTSDQVNFDGTYPYADDEKGSDYRGRIVDTGSLPINPWGLYEMHGNVWEWCADWFGEYPVAAGIDPRGPEKGGDRVVRGGGLFDSAQDVRSACRRRNSPGNRNGFTGFRLARG